MKKLFETEKLGSLTLKNRLIRSAIWENMAAPGGHRRLDLLDIVTLNAANEIDSMPDALAVTPDSRAVRGYLVLLAGRLGLADALVDHFEATVSAAKV